jgi:hypothetical protein
MTMEINILIYQSGDYRSSTTSLPPLISIWPLWVIIYNSASTEWINFLTSISNYWVDKLSYSLNVTKNLLEVVTYSKISTLTTIYLINFPRFIHHLFCKPREAKHHHNFSNNSGFVNMSTQFSQLGIIPPPSITYRTKWCLVPFWYTKLLFKRTTLWLPHNPLSCICPNLPYRSLHSCET